jgi:hypothetical protein
VASPELTTTGASGSQPAGRQQLWSTIINVAWIAIVLGVAIEIFLLLIAVGFGRFQALQPFVADGIQKISWSVLVCAGLAAGTTAAANARPAAMGLMGLLAAPIAFHLARTAHKIAAAMLGAAAPGTPVLSLFMLATLKGTEYAFLGALVGWIAKRGGGAIAHAGAGLLTGVVFGVGIIVMSARLAPAPIPAAALVSQAMNEIVFPIGCSLTLFVAQAIAKKQS